MNKEPKRWECLDCGCVSNKTRRQYIIVGMKSVWNYVCYKCSGGIKESDDWLKWYEEMRERTRPAALSMLERR